ncbi:MAG: hypothetical protein E7317_04720 [Clostridiales bacterium]|nr:hypothetical protein [Clostridiales bacterium]
METIIVEIFIPAVNKSFDFRLPGQGRVCDVVDEIIWILESTQQNLSIDRASPMLCDVEQGVILDPAKHIAETGLHDSSKLVLV